MRWVLAPAVRPQMAAHIQPQAEAGVEGRNYAIDYEFRGSAHTVAVELDGFAFHGSRQAFTYDRLRQNDLIASGRSIVRFSTTRSAPTLGAASSNSKLYCTSTHCWPRCWSLTPMSRHRRWIPTRSSLWVRHRWLLRCRFTSEVK